VNLRPIETVLAFLIAAAFAAAGDLVLARRSRTASDWAESFLVGAAASAALLFPLSVAIPGAALAALAVLLGVAAAARAGGELAWRRRGAPAAVTPDGGLSSAGPATLALRAAVVLAAACFAFLNARTPLGWDGFQIWAARAQLLFFSGGLSRPDLPANDYLGRLLNYPPLLPLNEALLAWLRGAFDFDALKPVFLPFYAAMIVSTHEAARRLSGRVDVAAAAAALLAFLPLVSSGAAARGYADMPVAAYVAAASAAALGGEKQKGSRALAWLLGGLALTKAEGVPLAVLGGAAALACGGRLAAAPARRRILAAAVPLVAILALQVVYLGWIARPEPSYGPLDMAHLARAARRVPEVFRLCSAELLEIRRWGFLWIALLGAAGALVASGAPKAWRYLALATSSAILLDASFFLLTNWPVTLHVEQAWPRLLQQLAPAATVVLAAAWTHLSAGEGAVAARRARAAVASAVLGLAVLLGSRRLPAGEGFTLRPSGNAVSVDCRLESGRLELARGARARFRLASADPAPGERARVVCRLPALSSGGLYVLRVEDPYAAGGYPDRIVDVVTVDGREILRHDIAAQPGASWIEARPPLEGPSELAVEIQAVRPDAGWNWGTAAAASFELEVRPALDR
jgi:hypothetical protein